MHQHGYASQSVVWENNNIEAIKNYIYLKFYKTEYFLRNHEYVCACVCTKRQK